MMGGQIAIAASVDIKLLDSGASRMRLAIGFKAIKQIGARIQESRRSASHGEATFFARSDWPAPLLPQKHTKRAWQ